MSRTSAKTPGPAPSPEEGRRTFLRSAIHWMGGGLAALVALFAGLSLRPAGKGRRRDLDIGISMIL